MGTHGLPDIYAPSPLSSQVYTRQTTHDHAHMAAYNYIVYHDTSTHIIYYVSIQPDTTG